MTVVVNRDHYCMHACWSLVLQFKVSSLPSVEKGYKPAYIPASLIDASSAYRYIQLYSQSCVPRVCIERMDGHYHAGRGLEWCISEVQNIGLTFGPNVSACSKLSTEFQNSWDGDLVLRPDSGLSIVLN